MQLFLRQDEAISSSYARLPRVLLETCALLLTAWCILPTAFGQSPDRVDVVKIDTNLVNLNVSVFDHKSRNPKMLE